MAPPSDRLHLDNLDDSQPTDPRWTESKLVAAGYTFNGDGTCKDCGDPVSFYKREHADATKRANWKVLEEGSLAEHRCLGR